tara:strand:+ start:6314 stop:7204 length:891 start_codon:yes stop_codon:yes gene_type:complete
LKTLLVHGHRGARGNRPENTLAGFAFAVEAGVDGLELDIRISADSQIIVHHDEQLNCDLTRDYSRRWLRHNGPAVYNLTLDELKKFDIGRINPSSELSKQFPDQVSVDGERICTLSEVAEFCNDLPSGRPILNIEVKSDPFHPHATPPPHEYSLLLVRELKKLELVDNSWVQSFDWRILRQVQQLCPEITTCYLTSQAPGYDTVGNQNNSPWLAGFDLMQFNGNIAAAVLAAGGRIWGPSIDDLSNQRVEEAHAVGIPIHCWTVNRSDEIKQLMVWQLAGVTTDYPELAVRMAHRI